MKKITLKALLMAAALGMGGNVWAGTATLYSQNYELATDASSWVTQSLAPTLVTNDPTYGKYISMDVGNNNSRSTYTNWGSSFYGEYTSYTLEFDANFTVTTNNTRNQASSFAIMSDGYTLPTANYGYASTYLFKIASTENTTTFTINDNESATFSMPVGVWCHYTIVVDGTEKTSTYTITNKTTSEIVASGTYNIPDGTSYKAVGMYYLCGRYYSVGKFDNISIITEVNEDVANPATIGLIGLNGKERTYKITYTEGETLHYILPGADEKTVSTGSFVEVSTNTSGTLKAWTTNGTATSSVVEETVDASEITLNAPWIYISGMSANASMYNPILDGGNDQNSVLLKPSATQTATFTPEGGAAIDVTLPYAATQKGVLTVTVSATGYTSASISFSVEEAYIQTWQSLDFSSLVGIDAVQTALGTGWTLQDGHGRWASWNKDKDGQYNFYQHGSASGNTITINENIRMRDVVLLAEGMGLGRNVTGEAIAVSNTVAGQVVAFEIYNGYGNDINKGVNTYKTYVRSNGTENPSMSSNSGALLVQATIYSPAVSKSITSAGYATYYSPYALDFTGTGLTAYVATVDGNNVSFTEVDKVPANTGVLLKGAQGTYAIPVTADGGNATSAMRGVTEDTEIAAGIFVLLDGKQGVGFYETEDIFTVGANTAYIPASVVNVKDRFIGVESDDATAITAIEATDAIQNGVIYNLSGQRVVKPLKGIYIQNGKKIIVK